MPANPSLDAALPELRAAEARLRALAQSNGISYSLALYGGMRTQSDTTKILNFRLADYRQAVQKNPAVARVPINTFRPIAPFGRSPHNYGCAFDITIDSAPRGMTKGQALAYLGALAPRVGLRWGGTFPSDRLDPPHFELPMSVVDMRDAYLRYTNGRGYVEQGPAQIFAKLFGGGIPAMTYTPSITRSQPAPVSVPETPELSFTLPAIAEPIKSNAAQDQDNNARVVGSIGLMSSLPPLAEPLGDVVQAPTFTSQTPAGTPAITDATDAVHLAQADELTRQTHMKIVAGLVIVGLIVASSHSGRRRR